MAAKLALGVGLQVNLASPWASIFARVACGVAIFGVYGWFFSGLLRNSDKRALVARIKRRR